MMNGECLECFVWGKRTTKLGQWSFFLDNRSFFETFYPTLSYMHLNNVPRFLHLENCTYYGKHQP